MKNRIYRGVSFMRRVGTTTGTFTAPYDTFMVANTAWIKDMTTGRFV